jgi:hypothetical protein
VSLEYRNARGERESCGSIAYSPESERLVLSWLIQNGKPQPGDQVRLLDGRLLVIALGEGEA